MHTVVVGTVYWGMCGQHVAQPQGFRPVLLIDFHSAHSLTSLPLHVPCLLKIGIKIIWAAISKDVK